MTSEQKAGVDVRADGDIVGIDRDGNSILWNADAKRGENSGEPPTDDERAALARVQGAQS